MECREFEALEPAYPNLQSGPEQGTELAEHDKRRLEAHLLECSACARAYQMRIALDDLLRDAVVHREVKEDRVIAEVRTRIASQRPRNMQTPGRGRGRGWVLAWASAVVMGMLLLIAGAYLLQRPAPADLFTDAVADHFQEVTQHSPVEWTSDRVVMRKLLQDWVGDPAIADALTPPGFHLSRIRICELMNRNYLHLVYANGAQELSVFLRRRDGESFSGQGMQALHDNAAASAVYMARQGQIEVAGFQTPVVTVLFVGNVQKSALRRIAIHAADAL
ncbi:MAG: hypothetical protein ABI383_12645 [Acidobacteriaceae bacterium]